MAYKSKIIKQLPNEISGFLIQENFKNVYTGNPAVNIPELTIYSRSSMLPVSLANEMIRWIQQNDIKKESRPKMGLFIATLNNNQACMTVSLEVHTTARGHQWPVEVQVGITKENSENAFA